MGAYSVRVGRRRALYKSAHTRSMTYEDLRSAPQPTLQPPPGDVLAERRPEWWSSAVRHLLYTPVSSNGSIKAAELVLAKLRACGKRFVSLLTRPLVQHRPERSPL